MTTTLERESSARTTDFRDERFFAVKREFVYKVDGGRPLLYPLDTQDIRLFFLTPAEGLAVSLLRGDTPFCEIRRMFAALAQQAAAGRLDELLLAVDRRVRQAPSQSGIGLAGFLDASDAPLRSFQAFDPRAFVVSPSAYAARLRDARNSHRLDTPINIYTVFTHRCLVNCRYCYADRVAMRELPLSRWRELVQEMEDLEIYMCAPDNGDVLARPDGLELLECLLEHELHFLLSTKAFVSREQVRRLVAAGLARKVRGVLSRRVQLSVDAAEDAVLSRLLNVRKPRIAGYLATFESFLAFGIMPKVKAVITGLNYDQPEKIVDLFYPRGARNFQFVRYMRTFHRHADELFVRPEHVLSLQRQFDRIRERYPDAGFSENLTLEPGNPEATEESARARWRNRSGCGGGWSTLGIAPDGRAFLCEQMSMREPFFVGDVSRAGLRGVWNGAELRAFINPERERFEGTPCRACAEFEECMWKVGRCYRDAYFAYGSIYDAPPQCPENHRPGLRMV